MAALMELSAGCEGAPRWSETAWGEIFAGRGVPRVVWVAERSKVLVGLAVGSCAGETSELESVAVLAAERHQGVGRTLCNRVMRWSAEQGAHEMALEVRASSAGALALYSAMGFVEQGRRREYYRAPMEDAVLMRAKL